MLELTLVSLSQRPEIREPIILWWTDGDDQLNEYLDCGDVRCFVTGNRNLTNDPQTKVPYRTSRISH